MPNPESKLERPCWCEHEPCDCGQRCNVCGAGIGEECKGCDNCELSCEECKCCAHCGNPENECECCSLCGEFIEECVCCQWCYRPCEDEGEYEIIRGKRVCKVCAIPCDKCGGQGRCKSSCPNSYNS